MTRGQRGADGAAADGYASSNDGGGCGAPARLPRCSLFQMHLCHMFTHHEMFRADRIVAAERLAAAVMLWHHRSLV